jgi:transcriptional regulator with XRE-family HTH domain
LGSKYFGRAIKKWRLVAGLSQEDLAGRAEVSVTLVGTVERERGHISEEIFSKLCLGLESKLGKPMLGPVFYDGIEALWKDLLSSESDLRQERGWAAAEYETLNIGPEDLEQAFDSALTEVKKCALLWYRALGLRGWSPVSRADFPPEEPGRTAEARKVRVRMPGQKAKHQRIG